MPSSPPTKKKFKGKEQHITRMAHDILLGWKIRLIVIGHDADIIVCKSQVIWRDVSENFILLDQTWRYHEESLPCYTHPSRNA